MNSHLESILAHIEDGTLLPAEYFLELNCDQALDARDKADSLQARWTALFIEISDRWSAADISDSDRMLSENIRKRAFRKVRRITNQHEIASYVSDDFDLIVRAKLIGFQDKFLDDLWAAYLRGEFPMLSRPELTEK